jgi:hypothetical protein
MGLYPLDLVDGVLDLSVGILLEVVVGLDISLGNLKASRLLHLRLVLTLQVGAVSTR